MFKFAEKSYDDDSDFHESDEELEDDGLCNTMFIVGPVGCGKTAAVYTCAHEMGFQVCTEALSGWCVLTRMHRYV